MAVRIQARRPMPARKTSRGASQSRAKTPQNQPVADALGRIRGLESEIAKVIHAMQEKVQQLELLNGFSSLLNSTLDTGLVREKALEATCKLLRCETASLLLVDPEKGELYWETALGETGKQLQKTVRLAINDRSIAGYVAMTGESVVVNDVESDPRYFGKKGGSGFRTLTMVCVPLKV